ncbi:ribosome biogenesis GTPase YqeH [Allofustis seminis]|uniref:ribosome biogenesis GTPase YqeH n=1 Tax=Allofustis seminis TaxID=166939 RepID=UPI000368FF3F|nr:ribosome biogenesis GTPase YqeH [Allofustis seminis]
MTKESGNDLICIGCGATIQTHSPELSGYVPAATFEKQAGDVYCRRCFRLRHYNEIQDVEQTNDDFLAMIHALSATPALIVYVVDLFDVSGTMLPGIQRFAGDNPILVVGNKKDVLPSSLKEGKMRQWLIERMHDWGVRPQECQLVSALQSESVKVLMQTIERLRKGRDVYVVGATNVGKSTLINQMIQIGTESKRLITTSYFPGTTLGKIMIPLDDTTSMIDTPGIILKTNYTHYLDAKDLKEVVPQKEIKPKNYPLKNGQTLFFGGLARMDYKKGPQLQHFQCYFSNRLPIHRTKTEKAAELFEKQAGKLLTPTLKGAKMSTSTLIEKTFVIKQPTDLVIAGLGWIHIKEIGTKVSLWVPKNIEVTMRKPMIG